MKVRVVFYGGLKQDVGAKDETLNLDEESMRVAELSDLLVEQHPQLASRLSVVAYAVNDEIVDPDYILQDGDVISLLPPVSGG